VTQRVKQHVGFQIRDAWVMRARTVINHLTVATVPQLSLFGRCHAMAVP
jgi:hypothetical protein